MYSLIYFHYVFYGKFKYVVLRPNKIIRQTLIKSESRKDLEIQININIWFLKFGFRRQIELRNYDEELNHSKHKYSSMNE